MLRPLLVIILLVSWSAPLGAQPAEEAVRFQYSAPPECPDAGIFTARVRERTPRGRLAEPGELARTFSVKLDADAPGFTGAIEFLDDGGAKVSRRLHGEQCDAVVSSLALITALALDATLREEERPAPAPLKKSSPPAEPPPPLVRAHEPQAPRRAAPARSLTSARVGVAGGYDSTIPALGLALLGQLDWRSGFALRLAAHYSAAELAVDDGRRAKVRILGVETSVCPWRFRADQLALAPCAALDLGSLRAEGVKVPGGSLTSTSAATIVWAAVGTELRVAWEPNAPFWVELHGAVGFPLRQSHRFRFRNPDKDAYEVPAITGGGGVATGVRFW